MKDQTGKNVQIYADNRIALLPSDNIGYMRHHTPVSYTHLDVYKRQHLRVKQKKKRVFPLLL